MLKPTLDWLNHHHQAGELASSLSLPFGFTCRTKGGLFPFLPNRCPPCPPTFVWLSLSTNSQMFCFFIPSFFHYLIRITALLTTVHRPISLETAETCLCESNKESNWCVAVQACRGAVFHWRMLEKWVSTYADCQKVGWCKQKPPSSSAVSKVAFYSQRW